MLNRIVLMSATTMALFVVAACGSNSDSTNATDGASPPDAPQSSDAGSPKDDVAAARTAVATELGSLQDSRVSHSATLLNDGRVIVVGGMEETFNPLRTAEIFDPVSLQWSPAGEMSQGRSEHAAVLLPDGRVMVTGGLDENISLIATTEIYDPETGLWTDYGSMRSMRRGHYTLPLPDGKVVVVGGVGQTLGGLGILANISEVGALVSTEIYDPVANKWSKGDDMREGHSGGLAILLDDGRVLISGGYNQGEALASSEIFDGRTGEWTRTKSMARKTFANTATVLPDGTVLFTGGFGMSITKGGITPGSEVFDPVTNEWQRASDTVYGRMGHTITRLNDGRVVTIGGSTAQGPANSGEYLNPATGEWSEIAPMSLKRSDHTATLLEDGRILVAGGSIYPTVELYDPNSDEWTSSDP